MSKHRADRAPVTGDSLDAPATAPSPAYGGSHRDQRGAGDQLAPGRGRRTPTGRLAPTAVGATLLVATAAAAVVLVPRAPASVQLSAAAASPSAAASRPASSSLLQARTAAVAEVGALRAARATLAKRDDDPAISRDLARVGHADAVKQAEIVATAVRERRARERAREARRAAARRAAARAEAARRARQWQLPVTPGAYHLTAGFGACSGLWSHCHTGLDFAAPSGTPIHAVATGTISETSYDGAYGNKTVETLPDGTELWYCHQTAYSVEVGQHVTAGEVIGSVGSTGNTTGPHVHLEVRPDPKTPIDPFAALVSHGLHP